MSTQYLDKLGLAHFWSKLKAYFQPILVSGQNIKTINNESLLGSGNITVSGGSSLEIGMTIPYGECSTAADTAAKTVTLSDTVTLDTGLMIAVKFTHYNSVSNPTLNVNSLGAISIMRYGETAPLTASTTSWQAGSVILLMYDGTYWQMCDWTNTNTTYSSMSTTEMKNGTATTARTITAARLKEAVLYYRGGTATPTANSISKFDSDAHMNSTDMTQQEVEDFVDSLDAKGVTVADYIVEQGTEGIWTYRKWNSGIAECWGYTVGTSIACTTQWGSAYYSAPRTYDFPTGLFIPYPIITATLYDGGGLGWVTLNTWTKDNMSVYVSEPISNTRTMQICFQVVGRWKNE